MKIIFISIFLIFGLSLQSQNHRVLFLGNSYTSVNGLPQLTADVAASVGDSLEFESNTPGSYTLEAHASNSTSLGLIMQGNWDFVILQEQSQRPSLPISQVEVEVFPYARFLDSLNNVYSPCGETMFYMTWGRKNGDASNCGWWPPVCTYIGMDSLLHLRYMMMADSNHAVVSPVGAVWRYIRQTYPNIELYQLDESHPSAAGTYAAACCFYTAIYQKDPSLITYNSTLDPIEALKIRTATKLIVYDSLLRWHLGEYDLTADFNYTPMGGYTFQFTNLSENSNGQIWDFGDETDTTTNPIYTFPGQGEYNVQLTSFNPCDTIATSQTISIFFPAIDENSSNEDWVVYPNPVNDKVNLRLNSPDEIAIKIYNLKGEKVLSMDHFIGNKIDVSKLIPGVYFIEIIKGNDTVTKRIIKN